MGDDHSTLPRNAAEANSRGEPKFFTGVPCRNGHVSPRYVKSRGACVQCCDEQKARRASREPDVHRTAYVRRRHKALEYGRQYREKNAERLRFAAREYARANADEHRRRAREWRSRNLERAASNVKRWKCDNSARWREYSSRFQKENAAYFAAAASHRKAAKLMATPLWSDREAISAVYAEARRVSIETGTPHHVDHIVPLQGRTVCGLHVHWNLRVIPAAENIAKGNRLIEV